jgi:hypothetical protein
MSTFAGTIYCHMNRFLFLFAFMIVAAMRIEAQEYTPATIYTHTGDTITCLLKTLKSYTAAGNFYYVEKETDKKEKKLYKDDIDSLIVGQEVYRFLKIHYKYAAGIETQIFQELVQGPLTLYAKSYVQTQALTAGGQLRGQGEVYKEYYLKKEEVDQIKKIGRVGFKKNILKYVDRCDPVAQKIYAKEYAIDDLIKIVAAYNMWYQEKYP